MNDRHPLGRGELLGIFGFWTFFALLWTANGLLAPPGRIQPQFPAAPVALAFVTAYSWALITPLIFWLVDRVDFERRHGAWRLIGLFAVALLIALGMDLFLGFLRHELFFDRPSDRGAPPGFLMRVSRLWFANQLVLVAAIVAAAYARLYFRRYQARREEALALQGQLADARLSALRSQLDPHFLFNTLNAMSALVERDPRGVRRMIARLSELLRATLEGANVQEVPLREELRFLEGYLDIMQVRFQGRLGVELRIEPGLGDALVPNLILQPLVENALRHGVAKIEADGRILVAAYREGGEAVLVVEDNGPASVTQPEIVEGVGTRNTRERLLALYGARQRFSLAARPDGGMRAEVRLPFHT